MIGNIPSYSSLYFFGFFCWVFCGFCGFLWVFCLFFVFFLCFLLLFWGPFWWCFWSPERPYASYHLANLYIYKMWGPVWVTMAGSLRKKLILKACNTRTWLLIAPTPTDAQPLPLYAIWRLVTCASLHPCIHDFQSHSHRHLEPWSILFMRNLLTLYLYLCTPSSVRVF